MGKNLTSIPGTSGPSHPLQSTIQPILGVLEQFWPKTLLSRRIPQLAPAGLGAHEFPPAPRRSGPSRPRGNRSGRGTPREGTGLLLRGNQCPPTPSAQNRWQRSSDTLPNRGANAAASTDVRRPATQARRLRTRARREGELPCGPLLEEYSSQHSKAQQAQQLSCTSTTRPQTYYTHPF